MPPGYDRQLDELIGRASARVRRRISAALPLSAGAVLSWMRAITGGRGLKAYFQHPRAFPALLLPWWLDRTTQGSPDLAFHADLAYSTIQGYLAVRLVDDVMDEDAGAQPRLLPATSFFHTEFESVYRRRFEPRHAFWRDLHKHMTATADAAIADAALEAVDAEEFRDISAAKVSAGLVPLAAVAHRARGAGLPTEWTELFRGLAEWHQLRNDFFDWPTDLERGSASYILSEATRHRAPGEPVASWMAREGLEWGVAALRLRLQAVRQSARLVDALGAAEYLAAQQVELDAISASIDDGLRAVSRLTAG